MKRIIISASLFALLVGCAIIPAPSLQPLLTTSAGRHPQLNEETEVTVGSALFSEWNYKSQIVAILSDRTIPRTGTAAGGTEQYCYVQTWDNGGNDYGNFIMCYYSSDGKTFDKHGGGDYKQIQSPIPIPFTRTETIMSGLKYELIYDGVKNNTLNVTYKEYINDIDTPTYTRELTYPISKFPVTIDLVGIPQAAYAVQGPPKIELLGIQGNIIRYKVLSGSLTPSPSPGQSQQTEQPGQNQ